MLMRSVFWLRSLGGFALLEKQKNKYTDREKN